MNMLRWISHLCQHKACLTVWGYVMSTATSQSSIRKAINVTIGEALLTEAKLLRINISQAAESGLTQAVAERRATLWLEANRAALESSNSYVETNGLPLASYRKF